MSNMLVNKTIYRKHQSFKSFSGEQSDKDIDNQKLRAIRVLANNDLPDHGWPSNWQDILERARKALTEEKENKTISTFKITPFIADEMRNLSDSELPRYFYHRYRYDVFPSQLELDDYPPYVQIEPTSICNYRCVFCYQADTQFSKKRSPHMGTMKLRLFQEVIDQIEGNVEFISLASRGEPLICKNLPQMLDYTVGKFLNLKVNTNASRLSEKICHSLLNGSVRTLVFSIDATDADLYSKLRVNGNLTRVQKNIERFRNIQETQYPEVKIITRVSGVKVNSDQDITQMKSKWSGLVDQVAFVDYNPWETIYSAPTNDVISHCSDLWRRFFIWFDGKVNPCDSDYRSSLSVGNIGMRTIKELWRSEEYQSLRAAHQLGNRQSLEPCVRCVVV